LFHVFAYIGSAAGQDEALVGEIVQSVQFHGERPRQLTDPRPIAARPPNQAAGITPDEAKRLFRSVPDLDAVVKAAEAGDMAALIAMARGGDYCSRGFRASEIPDICKDGQYVPGIYLSGGTVALVPIESTRFLAEILAQQPVELDFASRDSLYGEGNGGEYYLMFRAATPVQPAGETTTFDRVGIVVRPGEAKPILWMTRGSTRSNALRWIQDLGIARYQVLIAPESVEGWLGSGEIDPSLPVPRPPDSR
jgi:hypothetical protein